jgi:hypothetical protein
MSAPRACRAFALGIAMASAILLVAPAVAGVYGTGLFQLGDGEQPAGFAGAARIQNMDGQAGPDWADLFTASGEARSDLGALGGRWAVFISDDVSLGYGFESTALAGPDSVRNGTARSADDIGNAYAYAARDLSGNTILYLGVERLADGNSAVEFELDQALVRLGHGGFGHGAPWQILGARQPGDLLVRLEFAGEALSSATVSVWASGWHQLSGTTGEGCDESANLCAIANASAIESGPWGSGQLAAGRFVEIGLDLGALLGVDPALQSLRIRTPGDIAFGYIQEGN